ncbi:hypothetical protein [Azohydromonas australica]|uniref:hypothetical protein n=1 Tax=Azohydromonas australica TaxID=364039 RepID=UPI0035C20DF5
MARKLPVIIGMALSASIATANFVDSNSVMIGIMSLAFFGEGSEFLGWNTIGDIDPVRLIGATSIVFYAAGKPSCARSWSAKGSMSFAPCCCTGVAASCAPRSSR